LQKSSWAFWFREYHSPVINKPVNAFNEEDFILYGVLREWQIENYLIEFVSDSGLNIWEPERSRINIYRTPDQLWDHIAAFPVSFDKPILKLPTHIDMPMGASDVTGINSSVISISGQSNNYNWQNGALDPDTHSSWYVEKYDVMYKWFKEVIFNTIDQ
jgi:hypothetical protein